MCAGISFPMDKINPVELDQFFTRQEFEKQRRGDLVETFFWQAKPFLPVEENGLVHLYHWGNREMSVVLPKTGWAKIESLRDGLWDKFNPRKVLVPSVYGYEKKKWFKTPGGVAAVKVRYGDIVRVYLLTQKATLDFIDYTGHGRMPVGKFILMSEQATNY